MTESTEKEPREGAVAVVCRQGRLLVIRRSEKVEAPGTFCFPGGAIEDGESAREALQRELVEELGVRVVPQRLLWHSVTAWHVALGWWLTALDPAEIPQPNPEEVSEVLWLTPAEMRELPALLISNVRFLEAWERGEFHLPIPKA